MRISYFSIVFVVAIFSSKGLANPTSFPILRPDSLDLEQVITSTDNLDAVVVEAEEGIEGTTDATTESSGVKEEFDPSDCFLSKSRGPCRAVIDSWFFNVGTKACEPFIYSGCQGNNNRFAAKAQCETHCSQPTGKNVTMETTTTTAVPSTTTIPTQPPKKLKPRLPDCPKFDGCADKCVIIQDRSDRGCKKCLCSQPTAESDKKVEGTPHTSVGSVSGLPASTSVEEESDKPILGSPNEVCNLPLTRGNCRAMMTRYRYDAKTKDCVQFHFGGCDGNGNNFVSKEKCRAYCKGQ